MEKPVAFISYAHRDNSDDSLTRLREYLEVIVGQQTGKDVKIFLDHDIEWGQNWRERIEESLDEVTFLIPIVTPSFFTSEECRNELRRFLDRERQLDRKDLVLPIYYRDTELLSDKTARESDEDAQAIHTHQYADWRRLLGRSLDSNDVRDKVEELASQIRFALRRVQRGSDVHPSPASRGLVASPRKQGAQDVSGLSSELEHKATKVPAQQPVQSIPQAANNREFRNVNTQGRLGRFSEPQGTPVVGSEAANLSTIDLKLVIATIDTTDRLRSRGSALANEGLTQSDFTRYEEAIAMYERAVKLTLSVLSTLKPEPQERSA
jgi:hypothetical protein